MFLEKHESGKQPWYKRFVYLPAELHPDWSPRQSILFAALQSYPGQKQEFYAKSYRLDAKTVGRAIKMLESEGLTSGTKPKAYSSETETARSPAFL